MPLSLFDVGDKHVIDVYVVFSDRPNMVSPLWKLLKPGFKHVEIWKPVGLGIWARVEPCLEYADVQVYTDPPWVVIPVELNPTAMRVQRTARVDKVRDLFFVGPITCVEQVKSFLGLRNAFIRTPWQLCKFLRKRST